MALVVEQLNGMPQVLCKAVRKFVLHEAHEAQKILDHDIISVFRDLLEGFFEQRLAHYINRGLYFVVLERDSQVLKTFLLQPDLVKQLGSDFLLPDLVKKGQQDVQSGR